MPPLHRPPLPGIPPGAIDLGENEPLDARDFSTTPPPTFFFFLCLFNDLGSTHTQPFRSKRWLYFVSFPFLPPAQLLILLKGEECVILTGNEAAPWVLEDDLLPESACISA